MSITCQCGARMACTDTRTTDNVTRRRYRCECGRRVGSTEVLDGCESVAYRRGLADGEARLMAVFKAFAQTGKPEWEATHR